MSLGLDGITLWSQSCAVPADNAALPRGPGLFSYSIPQSKRRRFWLLELALILRTNDFADLSHIALCCRSCEIA